MSEEVAVRGSFRLELTILALLAFACGRSERRTTFEDPHEAGAGGSGGTDMGGGKGSTSGTGEAGDGSTPEAGRKSVNLDGSPIYTRVQRLTNAQWERAVRDILRLHPSTNLAEGFATPVAGTADFTNNEKLLFVSSREALDFESGSEAVAALATASPETLDALDAGTQVDGFVRTLGRRAFRRPLTSDEAAKYQAVFELGESLYGAGFAQGAALVVRALLQSPHFLYRSELGTTDEPLNGYEIASKLSFWLLGTTPNDALLDAAADGELDSIAGVEAAARAMLGDSRGGQNDARLPCTTLSVRCLRDRREGGCARSTPRS